MSKEKTTAMFANIDVLYCSVCLEGKDRPDSMAARHTIKIQLAELVKFLRFKLRVYSDLIPNSSANTPQI